MAHRIDHSTRLVDANGSGKDGFTEGSAVPLVAATTVTDDWLNDMQETVIRPIEAEGITLAKGTFTQLLDALESREDRIGLGSWIPLKPDGSGTLLRAVYDSGSLIVAVGNGGTTQSAGYDTDPFTEVSAAGGYTDTLYDITKMGSVWITVGAAGGIQTSTNPDSSWTQRTAAGGFVGTFNAIATNGTIAVAVGTSGTIQTSTDGTTWTARTAGSGYTATFNSVAWDPTTARFHAGGDDGEIQSSTDGITWTRVEGNSASVSRTLVCARPGGGFYAAKQDGSTVYIRESLTGTSYNAVTSITCNGFINKMLVTHSDRRLVIVTQADVRHCPIHDLDGGWNAEFDVPIPLYGGFYARKRMIGVGYSGSGSLIASSLRCGS